MPPRRCHAMARCLELRLAATACCGVALLFACRVALGADQAVLHSALQSITADELQRHVDVLADDTFEGREAGSRGGHAAGTLLVGLLQKYGLKPAGDQGSYYQSFGANYRNVLGLLEGSDPTLRSKIILVGAHYDHVGYGSSSNSYGPLGYIHNGADDNASGVAGLLEMIDALRQLPQPPRRSILFAFWDGEEKGLLGSQHWARQPTVPLSQVAMAFNSDMIGRLKDGRVEVYGTRTMTGLRQRLSRANQSPDLWLDFRWEMKPNSDHHTFYERQIPVLMLHTGLHEDYHRPSDDAHRLNALGAQELTRLLLSVTIDVADADRLPPFRRASLSESPGDQREFERPLPLPPPRLGVSWRATNRAASPPDNSGERAGLEVTRVVSGSAAARAGLRSGDRLLQLDEWPIDDADEFQRRIMRAEKSVTLHIARAADAEPLLIPVTLDGRPSRVGITWRTDAADPSSFLLVQVLPGSPAHAAGLKPGDRLYEVDGQFFQASDQLAQWLSTATAPLELLVERRGQLRRLQLDLGE